MFAYRCLKPSCRWYELPVGGNASVHEMTHYMFVNIIVDDHGFYSELNVMPLELMDRKWDTF